MREIKFRFRLKMLHETWGIYKEGDIGVFFIPLLDKNYGLARFSIDKQWEILSCDLYTGLKDKNGKEIYESDILKYTYHRDRSGKDIAEFTDVIEWDGDNDSWSGFYVNKKMQHEIIGNIYENPDLIKGE